MATPDFTTADLRRRGEALFKAPSTFVKGVVSVADLPKAGRPEVAFAGRSNVGKSSLINALTGQKSLARVSVTPGRTRELNFFTLGKDDAFYLVDMPGYGYARASKAEIKGWTRLIQDYLKGRRELKRVFLLIDARHGLKDSDREIMTLLDEAAVSYQGVLTKADKPKASELAAIESKVAAELAKRPAAYPQLIATSARTGAGIPELRAAIAAACPKRRCAVSHSAAISTPVSKTKSSPAKHAEPSAPIPRQGEADLASIYANAKILSEALPFMQRYDNATVVVKYGGHAMGDPELAATFARDIVLIKQAGVNPIVVHGGGPQIGSLLERLNIRSEFKGGLRVTDRETVEVVEMVLAGSVNKEIVAAINAQGGKAVGISGKDANLMRASRLERRFRDPDSNIEEIVDLGFVGDPVAVDPHIIDVIIHSDLIPVIAPIGVGPEGETLNINADTFAAALATALKAKRLLLLDRRRGRARQGRQPDQVADHGGGARADRGRQHLGRHDPQDRELPRCDRRRG